MIIIPAVDIKNANCVRLFQGKESDETIYSSDPVEMAIKWEKKGAERLHVIDLDGAFTGKMANLEIISNIVQKLKIPVEVGGGIRELSAIKTLIDVGVEKVIIGTKAIDDKNFLIEAQLIWPNQIIVGLDSINNKVAVKGWKEITDIDIINFVQELEELNVKEIIVTDISKDGTLKGPNLELISKITEKVNINIIASGGISKIEDLTELTKLNQNNLIGIIIGKALYDEKIDLTEAIEHLNMGAKKNNEL